MAVHGLDLYRHPDSTAERTDALVVGYGTPPDHGWVGALEELCATVAPAGSVAGS